VNARTTSTGTDADRADIGWPAGGSAPDPSAVYALGGSPEESARLRRQSEELRPYAAELVRKVGLRPGQNAVDVGCGPSGILDLLAEAVAPSGRVVGLDADPVHVAMARQYAVERDLRGVEVMAADARHTGLPAGSFDLVHGRTLLVTLPDPGEVLAEMVRITKPGGQVASQEPDAEIAFCYPASPAWDRLCEIFTESFSREGADLRIGRRLAEMYRLAGLEDIEVAAYSPLFPAGHSRRAVRAELVQSLRPVIVRLGVASERELDELDQAVRKHLADPDVLVMPHLLFVAIGRKPASSGQASE
jgi:ubiquinone/menaquinone biosynthesis C-methylase UbiE